MIWIDIIRITVPGLIFGAILGKLLVKKPGYIKLIKPRYWIKNAKESNIKQIIKILTLSIIFGVLMYFIQREVGQIIFKLFGPLVSEKNIFVEVIQFSLPLFLISITIFPIIEEWIFRGVLLEEISQYSQSKIIGLISSSLLFALFHLSNPGTLLPAAIFYFVGGLIIGGSYLVGGLTVAVLAHIIYNISPFIFPF